MQEIQLVFSDMLIILLYIVCTVIHKSPVSSQIGSVMSEFEHFLCCFYLTLFPFPDFLDHTHQLFWDVRKNNIWPNESWTLLSIAVVQEFSDPFLWQSMKLLPLKFESGSTFYNHDEINVCALILLGFAHYYVYASMLQNFVC